jgi:hypothetical protein
MAGGAIRSSDRRYGDVSATVLGELSFGPAGGRMGLRRSADRGSRTANQLRRRGEAVSRMKAALVPRVALDDALGQLELAVEPVRAGLA